MPSAIRIIDQAAEIVVDASGFTGNLSGTDTDVQTALGTIDAMSSGGTPGGTTKQVQYNNAGAFGGAAGVEYQAGASPNLQIQAQNAAHVPLVAKLAASQTANGFELRTSADGLLYAISPLGHVGVGIFPSALYSVYLGESFTNVEGAAGIYCNPTFVINNADKTSAYGILFNAI